MGKMATWAVLASGTISEPKKSTRELEVRVDVIGVIEWVTRG
jgi:hypothetical protein